MRRRTPLCPARWLRPVVMGWLLAGFVGLGGCRGTNGSDGVDAEGDAAGPRDAGTSEGDIGIRRARPLGADCEAGVECASKLCLHGMCSDRCEATADCADERFTCVVRGGAGHCTPVCSARADCRAGRLCVTVGPGQGFCAVPQAGPGGAACSLREECASWFCSGGRCLAPCDEAGLGAAAPGCPAETVCLPLHTQGVCGPAGQGQEEVQCERAAECRSGVCRGGRCTVACRPGGDCPGDRVCMVFDVLALCERRCRNSDDCGANGLCFGDDRQRRCVGRGTLGPGDRCVAHGECRSGRCEAEACARQCGLGCPEGSACVTDVSGSTCRVAGSQRQRGPCRRHADCATGFCAAGECSRDCADQGACPSETRCARFSNGDFCFPRCIENDDCALTAYCDESLSDGRICFWRGPVGTAIEGGCQVDRACSSGRCVGGRCLIECPRGVCPAGQLCLAFSTGPYCSPTPRPIGAPCDDDPQACADGLGCVAGRCLPRCVDGCAPGSVCRGGWCVPSCADGVPCRPGFRCNPFDLPVPFCEPPGEAGADEPCRLSGHCESGLCFAGRCRARCDDACSADARCLTMGGRGYCLAVGPGEPGAPCERDRACGYGLCVGRRCVAPCGEDAQSCPADSTCATLRAGRFCVYGCDPLASATCRPDEVCAPVNLAGEGRCVAAEGGAVPGARCRTLDECGGAAVACLDAGNGKRCRALCDVAAPDACPAGAHCRRLSGDGPLGACVPAGEGETMAPCEADIDCASGQCANTDSGRRCVAVCADTEGCAPGERCVDLARDPNGPFRVCVPACELGDDACPEGLQCRRGIAPERACY